MNKEIFEDVESLPMASISDIVFGYTGVIRNFAIKQRNRHEHRNRNWMAK